MRVLDGKDILALLDDTQDVVAPIRVCAEVTRIDVGQVVAGRAMANRPFHVHDGGCELFRFGERGEGPGT